MTLPASASPGRAPITGLAAVGRVLLTLGVLALCPVASCSGIAWLKYRSDAADPGEPRTAAELVRDPPGWHDVIQTELTPEPSRALAIRIDGAASAAIVPVAESPRLALLVYTSPRLVRGTTTLTADGSPLPGSRPARFVVHRDDHVLMDPEYWGTPRDELVVFALEDPRVGAASEVLVTRTVAATGAAFGIVLVAVGVLLLQVGRRRVGPHRGAGGQGFGPNG